MLAGCGRFNFDPTGGADDAGGNDGGNPDAMIDAPMSTTACVDPGNGDTFATAGTPCQPWGTLNNDRVTVTQSGGAITMTPPPNVQGPAAACTHTAIPFSAGVMLEVSSVLNNVAGSQTFFTIRDVAGAQNSFTIFEGAGSGMLRPSDTAMPAQVGPSYDPVAHRFWRMRPNAGKVVFEASPDASTWSTLAVSTLPVPVTVTVSFGALEVPQIANPGTARFESINTCP